MTAHLRDLLGALAQHEAHAAAAAAPDPRTEAEQVRAQVHRLRARRVITVTTAAAAAVAVGIVTANAVTGLSAVQPALPAPSVTATASPTPTPTAASPTPTPTTASPTPTAPSPSTPPTTPPARPQPADVAHGNRVWGTYVAVVDSFDSPAAVAATARVTELGYAPSGGEIACDQGAGEALGFPPETLVVATYLASKEDAELFAQLYGPGAVGIAEVTLFCLD
ncbi:hypothetical protein [Cellulomonas fengjieae]|uniref:LytR/CpsA/Psr regulator C-terminal domain-containing protein n=1 Tax=Cellulomonas fengjieae TaxID=2819978 RepID=A0ABS3SK17_9CELL|nr:hypothetical protein [Cellulomonas fengjieae]MBO3086095.1 hypothetical protein [Cellulomonas fengjieae]QVI65841.1 hypothetical protein KG102_17485 [Cellulomonas fengjieae]